MSRSLPALVLILAAMIVGRSFADTSNNVFLLSNLDEHADYNDLWGYTAPDGREYVLLGTGNGVAVINVEDPAHPREVAFVPGVAAEWRDIKTLGSVAYVVNDRWGGVQIVDLTDPEAPYEKAPYRVGHAKSHNLTIDAANARGYLSGSNAHVGFIILDLQDPIEPVEIGRLAQPYLHDVVARGDLVFGVSIRWPGTLHVFDVSDPSNIVQIASRGIQSGHAEPGLAIDSEGRYALATTGPWSDRTSVLDIQDPMNPIFVSAWEPPTGQAKARDVVVEGNLAFVAQYTSGLKILDISDPTTLIEVGSFDSYALNDGRDLLGCRGVFTDVPSNPDLLYISDSARGLFVLEYKGTLGTVAGVVTRSDSGMPVAGVAARVAQTGREAVSDSTGMFVLQDLAGTVDLEVSRFGFESVSIPVELTVGDTLSQDVALSLLPGGTVTGTVTSVETSDTLPYASVGILGAGVVAISDALGRFELEPVPLGTHSLEVECFGYDARVVPAPVLEEGVVVDRDVWLVPALHANDFENEAMDWTVSGNAVRGTWEVADPQGTEYDGHVIQPEDDHTPPSGQSAGSRRPTPGCTPATTTSTTA
jgi:choice-of-anchor B domain-containing protein